jgi:hypothetical protein
MKSIVCLLTFFLCNFTFATPSSNLWAPSTANCQPFSVPHITYDSYFRSSADYPTDFGLTTGILPFEKIQAEIGWDMLLPSENPHLVNGKLCTPESSLFVGSPAISFGAYAVGFKKNVTDYNIAYLVLQKEIPGVGGSISIGGYHGFNKTLLTNSDGKVVQAGVIAALVSPDINLGLKGLPKLNFLIDLQSGKNVVGAWAIGSNIYFANNVSLLVGPVFFFDPSLQPHGADSLWALELDIDIPFERAP